MKTNKRKGISLIVLIITIIVMIILAGAIILSLNSSNIIDKAKSAKEAQNISSMNSAVTLILGELELDLQSGVKNLGETSKVAYVKNALEEQGFDLTGYGIYEEDNQIRVAKRDVKQIYVGESYIIVLMNDGTAKACGNNMFGNLLDGTKTQRTIPVSLRDASGPLSDIKEIAIGHHHSFAIMNNGIVKGWGLNDCGQIGNGETAGVDYALSSPVDITGISGVKQMALGQYHTAALTKDGVVWTWGHNNYGQLGDNTTINKKIPVKLPALTGVKQIAAGNSFTAVLMNDGTVKTWGQNSNGQLGDNTTTNKSTPVNVSGLTGVKQIAAGSSFMVALMNDGTLKSWGSNNYGQLGNNTTTDSLIPVEVQNISGVKEISAGREHVVAMLNDGTVMVWGSASHKQLGNNSTTSVRIPTKLTSITEIRKIVAGGIGTVALTNNGILYGWGYNYYGQLGDGTTATQQGTPINMQEFLK
ncbi:MAG: hypothetical protein PHR25_01650 [Clostridia bacterium]|nr:hypothetical protein [Clostridia bacterium]MDD4375467.1 hypothetical protein [Clostridia bacterium]